MQRIKGINPEKVFEYATQYEKAAVYLVLGGGERGKEEFKLPLMVLLAFSVELYLKAFSALLRDDRSHLIGHDHQLLFNDLCESERLEVERRYELIIQLPEAVEQRLEIASERDKRGVETDFSIHAVLSEGGKAFERLRYIHEHEVMPDGLYFSHYVGMAVKERILELRSDWQKYF